MKPKLTFEYDGLNMEAEFNTDGTFHITTPMTQKERLAVEDTLNFMFDYLPGYFPDLGEKLKEFAACLSGTASDLPPKAPTRGADAGTVY